MTIAVPRSLARSALGRFALLLVVSAAVVPCAEAAQEVVPAATARSCVAGSEYSGSARRQVPVEVWQRDFTRQIDGSLPLSVTTALHNLANDFTRRAPATSIAVAIPGVGRWATSQGVSHARRKATLPPDARFQVASTTKTLTAAAILQMEAEGTLLTSSSIEPWFPDAPNARITTLDHLLRHTSGLISFNALPSWTLDYRQPREAIAMAEAEPPLFCPGSNFAYSNTGYAMLGVVIEDIDKRPLHQSFQERFARPLGLKHTSLRHPGDDIPAVSGHSGGAPVEVADRYATPFAAGGLASTAEDLVTFWHALLSGQIVSSATVRTMFTDLAPMDAGGQIFYGRGVQLYDVQQGPGLMLGHSGGITGFASVVAYVVADDMYVSVVFNDQTIPAEAGLWAVVRAVRASRHVER
nr:serine hydrolase domain-containing protein [Chitinivorax sp. B]